MFAIVTISGKQYVVRQGDALDVDHAAGEVGQTLRFDQVLLVADEAKTTIGTPAVAGAAVVAKIVSQHKGEKIDVRRYKSKVRYRKARGFRPHLTQCQIVSIEQP